MRSRVKDSALWAVLGLVALFCSVLFLLVSQTHGESPQHTFSKRFAPGLHGPAHQNPAKAPAEPLPQAIEQLSTELTASHFLHARELHSLGKRDALRCDDGPCVDGSCCSKDKICGYGPDYCGTGCRSQCNATAMCGEYSENADMPCGMNLCCSAMGWCGSTEIYCGNADPLHGTLPCQAGYGSCTTYPSPSCSEGGGSSNGRTVGYYQSWNVRERACNKVSPKQLDTTGYTHLFYSFATINPSTYQIAPAHPDDDAMMREFTSLSKDGKLQTWIAIGGFDFSDPDRATHTTWSDLCSTKDRRTAFINSIKAYMVEYGFQGVDLDWEYPGAPERGGRKLQDVRNFATLVREMRAALGTSYGISVTLAPDYWYLRWFDAKAMEPYVDFFGFMAYDLHGSWDQDVKALGMKVRGQADIREISNNTVPLWFDGLNPAKINFGLAMYGRGYTLADPKCNDLLCPFSGPSKPGPCTQFQGVMSLYEIKQLIKQRGLTPKHLSDSMMKQITWDDQWIGYDDEETFAAKKKWANSRCFGGTMIWSIDFQVPGSEESDDERYGEVVYIGPKVYQEPTAQCLAPCIMVLPPSTMSKPTVITWHPYTATLEVGSTTTTAVIIPNPQTSTVTVVNYFNYYVGPGYSSGGYLTLTPSFAAPTATVVVTGQDGKTTKRTIVPPPFSNPDAPLETPSNNPTGATDVVTGWPFIPPPSTTPEPELEPEDEDEEDSEFPIFTGVEDDGETAAPVPTTWPSGSIKPVFNERDPVPPGATRIRCTVWFFWICISFDDLKIKIDFWDIVLPPGGIGPGPPPPSLLDLPKGWTVGFMPSPPPQPNPCKPTTAKLTIESTSYGTTTTGGTVKTTSTKTFSREFPLVGCEIEDVSTAFTTTACARPTARAVDPLATGTSSDDQSNAEEAGAELAIRAPNTCGPKLIDYVVMPENHNTMLDALRQRLQADVGKRLQGFNEISAPSVGFTGFFYLTQVEETYIEDVLMKNPSTYKLSEDGYRFSAPTKPKSWSPSKRSATDDWLEDELSETASLNGTENELEKRLENAYSAWAPSMISVPPSETWDRPNGGYLTSQRTWNYRRHSSECDGQTIYVIEQDYESSHPYFSGAKIQPLDTQDYGIWRDFAAVDKSHGTSVISMLISICPLNKVQIIPVLTPKTEYPWKGFKDPDNKGTPAKGSPGMLLKKLESLVVALEHIAKNKNGHKSVLVMSYRATTLHQGLFTCFLAILKALNDQNAVLVTSGGNIANKDFRTEYALSDYPSIWAKTELPNLIVAGSTDKLGRRVLTSKGKDDEVVYAPGKDVDVARANGGMSTATGTSFAAPAVAALVAYFRALPGPLQKDLEAPAKVKDLVFKMRRPLRGAGDSRPADAYQDRATQNSFGRRVPFIWNGHLRKTDTSCLVDMTAPGCPQIDISDKSPSGSCGTKKRGVDGDNDTDALVIRQNGGDSCPLEPANPGGAGSRVISFKSGMPSPTCTANCGTYCTDYWCKPNRMGQPPHFTDPANVVTKPAVEPMPTNCISSTTGLVCEGAGVGKSCDTTTRCLATATGAMGPFPTLGPITTDGGVPVGQICASSTTNRQCNGDPRHPVCKDVATCVSFKADPNFPTIATTTFQLPPSPSGGVCVSSTSWTILGGPRGQAMIPGSGCAKWSVPTTEKPAPTEPAKPKNRCVAIHMFTSNCALDGDIKYIQVYEDGVLTCDTAKKIYGASDDDVYQFKCKNGATASKKAFDPELLKFTAADGYVPELYSLSFKREGVICNQLETREIRGLEEEQVLSNNWCGNCPAPPMCGLDHCFKFKPACW
ncbi:Chitotriosidase-1 [Paramyrothecium foliicola]|nr:Chitotriosidase-1 [Paramyrothecium foliicola]